MNNRRDFLKQCSLAGLTVTTGLPEFSPASNSVLDSGAKETFSERSYKYIKFGVTSNVDPIVNKGVEVVQRIISSRTGLDFTKEHDNRLDVLLIIVPEGLPAEAYRIDRGESVSIIASDPRGILYGLGKFLRTSSFGPQGFSPGNWTGISVPEKRFRKIYFATHFFNFYHVAPVEVVTRYIEELALWGYNGLVVWYDMHHFKGINDPAAQAMLDRLAFLLKVAKGLGMDAIACMLGNEGYSSTPKALLATEPLQIRLRGKYGVEICPSQPGGSELIVKQLGEEIDAFKKRQVELDCLVVWPYDQGGCGCKQCTPWGSNGYLGITKKISAMVAKKLPKAKIVQSTWLYDVVEDEGEWAGLAAAYKKDKPPVDYILADSHETFPKYPLNNPSPGGLPMINFPEVSMWESYPWGAFGANPLPQRFQGLWASVRDKLAGGYPYSEGIFEDINKAIYSQFYWDSQRPVEEILKEYVSYEFSSTYASEIVRAIFIMEENHGLRKFSKEKKFRVPSKDYGSEEAYRVLQKVDKELPEVVRGSWRWRILFLRSMFDYELRKNEGMSNEKTEAGFKELMALYYTSSQTEESVRPPAAG
jgi:hypothetical protein